MARPKQTVPTYRLHRASGLACCYVNRERKYLGKFGSPESKRRFAEIVSEATAAGSHPLVSHPASKAAPATVNELLLRFASDELPRYADAEQHCFKGVIRILHQLFGETPAANFGPLSLRAVRESMIRGAKADELPAPPPGQTPKDRKPWSRSFINKQVKRLRLIFKFGTSWEMVPQTVCDSLRSVRSLSAGESDATESTPRTAVPPADLKAVRDILADEHRDIFDLLLLTGARPGEIVDLTTGAIDRSGDVWRAELRSHKTSHMGKRRVLFFNATAQVILLRHFKADPDAKLFKIQRETFACAVKRACIKSEVTPFVPHQLRHTVATKLVDDIGLEAAQRLMGHSAAAMTQHYSRLADKLSVEAAKRLG